MEKSLQVGLELSIVYRSQGFYIFMLAHIQPSAICYNILATFYVCVPFLFYTNTALRTANTAPSTMRFWEAASRWRSQEERIPTVGLSGETAEVRGSKSRNGVGGVATLSTAGRLRSRSLTSVRLARIELRCLEKVEEDAAGKPGPRLRVLFTASYREEDKAEGKG